MGRHSKPEFPGDRRSGDVTDTGNHRAVGAEATSRGFAKWPFIVLAVLAVVGGGVFAVVWGSNSLGNADAEGNSCSEGRSTLRVTVGPKLVEPLTTIGEHWNATDRPVHSHCITVKVSGAPGDDVRDELGKTTGVLAVPAVWIAESTEAADQLAQSNPNRVAEMSRPLKKDTGFILPYVVINGKGVDGVQQRAADEFRDYLDEPGQREVLAEFGFGS